MSRAIARSFSHRSLAMAILILASTLLVAALVSAIVRHERRVASPRGLACVDVEHGLPELAELEARLGRPLTCLTAFADQTTSWEQWEHPWFLTTSIRSARYGDWVRADPQHRRLAITLAMVPSTAPPEWRHLGASGAYDDAAAVLGTTLVAAGLGRSIIRLSPEANFQPGDRSIGSSPEQVRDWTAYWARLSADLKAVPGAHFALDWTVNAAVRPVAFASYYPGARAVDIIGIDCYDSLADGHEVAPGPGRWSELSAQPGGLNDLVAFAGEQRKPVSVPEWGDVSTTVGFGGGDDPYYVAQMAALFRRTNLAYESYFDVDRGGTLDLGQVPGSFSVYRNDVVGGR